MTKFYIFLNTAFVALAAIALLLSSVRPVIQIVSILLFLVFLGAFIYAKRRQIPLHRPNRTESLLCLALLAYALGFLPALLLGDGFVGREFDLPSKYLLFALIFVLFFRLKAHIRQDALFMLIAIAGILNGIITLLQVYIFTGFLQGGRADGFSGIGEFGALNATLCVMNFTIFMISPKQRSIFFIATIFAFIAVVATGLRGSMLAVGFAVLALFVLNAFAHIFQPKRTARAGLLAFYCLSALVLVGITMPNNRISYSLYEAQRIAESNYNDSVGMRLQMYKEAIAVFRLSPLIGMSGKTKLKHAQEIGEMSQTTLIFSKIETATKRGYMDNKEHNDILTAMSQGGLISLATLLFLYAIVALIAMRNLKNSPSHALILAMLFVYIGVGFSSDPLHGHPESTIFAVYLCFILSLRDLREKSAESGDIWIPRFLRIPPRFRPKSLESMESGAFVESKRALFATDSAKMPH